MNTKADLMAYLASEGTIQWVVDLYNNMSDAQAALFLTVRCSNSEAGVDTQLARFNVSFTI